MNSIQEKYENELSQFKEKMKYKTPMQRHRYQLKSQIMKQLKEEMLNTGLSSQEARLRLETDQEYINLLNTDLIETMCHVHKGHAQNKCKVDNRWDEDPFESYAAQYNKCFAQNMIAKNIQHVTTLSQKIEDKRRQSAATEGAAAGGSNHDLAASSQLRTVEMRSRN